MLPTPQDAHVDAALSQISVAYRNEQYIFEEVFPVVPVEKQSDKYYTFSKADLLRIEAAVRAPGTLAKRGGYRLSTTSFFCDNYAFGKSIPDELKKNEDAALNSEQNATEYTTDQVLLKLENQLASEIFAISTWGTDKTPTVLWSTYATSTPIEDVRVGIETVLLNTGRRPNQLVMGHQVWTVLQDHPDFVDRLSNQTTRVLQLAAAAQILGVDRVLIGTAVKNTAAEGIAASMSFVWGKNALLHYVPPSPGLMVPSSGYTFRWGPRRVLHYRDAPEGLQQDVVESHDYCDFKVVASDTGYYFNGAVA